MSLDMHKCTKQSQVSIWRIFAKTYLSNLCTEPNDTFKTINMALHRLLRVLLPTNIKVIVLFYVWFHIANDWL